MCKGYKPAVGFDLTATATGSRARTATLTTAHGTIETPVFMPVGTRGTVRTQTLAQLERLGAPILLANTYHLLARPGPEVFEKFGGLHPWMGWKGSILTDSGGFQIFSLAEGRAMSEEGAEFRHPSAGTGMLLTPERSIAMQRSIGSDIMMVLDQCIPSTSPHAQAKAAMELTHRWAKRSLDARGTSEQQLFAIVQGACFEDLRRESAAALTGSGGFDGYAIGGLAVGESRAQREDITELTTQLLPPDRPRYLMGVGTPIDLLEGVHRGVDMFDCILPTALAQHGKAFTSHGRIDLRRGVHKMAEQALDATCACEACTLYSRSYLHHLVKCEEPLGWQLLAFHNLTFYVKLMAEIRASIAAGTFAAFYAERREELALTDLDNPPGPKPRMRERKAMTLGAFGIGVSASGHASIEHLASGQVMHPDDDPNTEAERVYVGQSALIARALTGDGPALVIWDVGLGAAHNALALIRALDAAPNHAPIELVSFEYDLDSFRLALANTGPFPHLRHPAPHVLAHHGEFVRDRLRWRLVEGDFLTTFPAEPAPDVILYDPFSTKVDTPMWSLATLRALFAHLTRRTELFTYSASTAVRSSLLLAGFHVARGISSGPKDETTIALRFGDDADLMTHHRLLDHTWLSRRARSTAQFAADIPPEQQIELERMLMTHPQFV
ncbi:MAG: tRNA guanosine(34) transglycosylase Tgt [Deltaproteobacteria bacterium]|nr:tRNA guanosine(34) transglycosylase Tgt [Deltaproteobacteria bacterium]